MNRSSSGDRNGVLSKQELAREYNIHDSTLQRWLNYLLIEKLTEAGYQRNQKLLTPKQLEIIYEHFGKP